MNWIIGLNEVEIGKYSETYISNLEAIIIDTIASIESVSFDDIGFGRYRYVKCRVQTLQKTNNRGKIRLP